MKNISRLLFWNLWLLPVFADVVNLKDGRQIFCFVESAVTREIRISVSGGIQTIPVDRIESIQFEAPDAGPTSPVQPVPPVAAAPQTVTLPAGTEIAIRTIVRIDSKKADVYKEYAASLDDPIIVNGVAVVPANVNAFLRVSDVRSPGIKRRASLALSLIAITVDGQRVGIETDKVDSSGGSQAKRTAIGSAGGAATGAAIGAIAGGGLGAGVGAGIGAAGGALAGVMTGKGVEIAPETRFTYRLTHPVVITLERSSR